MASDSAEPEPGNDADTSAPTDGAGDGDEDDERDDSDSSGTPGGDSTDSDSDSGEQGSDPFFDALFSLIDNVLQLDPIAAIGDLLAVLSAATAADPEALGGLILLIDDANICDFDRTTCDVACGLLVGQCRACAENATCHEAMDRTCGELTADCH